MAKVGNRQKTEYNFDRVLELAGDAVMARLNCHNVGKIVEFDPLTQTATIEMMVIKQFNKRSYIPSLLMQVPLIIYGAGNAHITLPNPVGSICLVLFLDRNIDNFILTGEQYEPETGRMHDFSDCVALTTFKTLANPLQEYDERAISLLNNEIIENVKNNSYIKVNPESIVLNSISEEIPPEGEESENPPTSSNITISNTAITSVTSSGGQIQITDKINIQNKTQNLAMLLDSFLAACESIATVNGGALTPASKQLFTDLKTQFQELLQ